MVSMCSAKYEDEMIYSDVFTFLNQYSLKMIFELDSAEISIFLETFG